MSLDARLSELGQRIPLPRRVLALGLLTWLSTVVLPSLHREAELSLVRLALFPCAPGLLAAGLWLQRTRPRLASYALLTGVPLTLALSASRFDHDAALATFSPSALALALASLCGYLAAAAALCSEPDTTRPVDQRPLGEVSPVDLEHRKQLLGHSVLSVIGAGALLLVSWASWATPAHFREQWGRAAPEGATLTALMAGLVGGMALTLVGPALRAERGPVRTREQRRRRVTWLLLVATSGAIVYAVLRSR